MTVVQAILLLVGMAIFAYLAYYIITTFLPDPAKKPVLAIVGVLLLIFLLTQFFPGAANFHLWK